MSQTEARERDNSRAKLCPGHELQLALMPAPLKKPPSYFSLKKWERGSATHQPLKVYISHRILIGRIILEVTDISLSEIKINLFGLAIRTVDIHTVYRSEERRVGKECRL